MSSDQLKQPLLLSFNSELQQRQRQVSQHEPHHASGNSNLNKQNYGCFGACNHSQLGASEAGSSDDTYNHHNQQLQQRQRRQSYSLPAPLMPIKFEPDTRRTMSFKFKCAAFALLLVMFFTCAYGIWSWRQAINGETFRRELKMVNMFTRHGDRAPSNLLPKGDRHIERIDYFWPNGLKNLTDTGRFRSYKIGLDTRQRYNNYLGFNSSHILAFSSSIYRCIESTEFILRALYNTDTGVYQGLAFASQLESCKISQQHCHLSTGLGSADEWRNVNVDTKFLPSLSWERLNECKYRKEHPAEMDSDLMVNPDIRSLVGVEILKEILEKRYDINFDFDINSLWSTINSELNLIRTHSTIEYIHHCSDWLNQPALIRPNFNITMFDLLEVVVVLIYRGRVRGAAQYIQNSPIITSLIESQMVALGYNATNNRMYAYKDKRMILYSSHDSVLQEFLQVLGIVCFDGSFEDRFEKHHKASDLEKFLNGLKMSRYSLSLRFELWQLELPSETHSTKAATTTLPDDSSRFYSGGREKYSSLEARSGNRIGSRGGSKRFDIVELSIYNKEDAKHEPIEYKRIEFGSACRRLFKQRYPDPTAIMELERFYDSDFEIDRRFSCPFKLLRNVTSEFMLNEQKLQQLCQYKTTHN